MKNIFLPILSLSILFGVVLLYNSNNEKTYTPISERIISKGIDVSQQYLNDRKVNQISGKVDLSDVYEANKQVNLHRMLRSQNDHTVEWQEMGPDNVGGRTRAILIDKDDSTRIYAGAVSGGLWISETGGRSWRNYSDYLGNLNISCITQASNGDIYVGTGEVYFVRYGSDGDKGSGFVGNGVYKKNYDSDDFVLLPSTAGNLSDSTINNNSSGDWSSVNEIVAHPTNDSLIIAATSGGLQISQDAGETWSQAGTGGLNPLDDILLNVNAIDVKFSPDGSYAIAVAGLLGQNKIFKSSPVDPSQVGLPGTWERRHYVAGQNPALPGYGLGFHPDLVNEYGLDGNVGRIEVAISPSNPNIVYCAISDDSGNGNMKGIFRSEDAAETWGPDAQLAPPSENELDIFTTQARYAMLLEVHPTNPDKIYAGGLDLWTWTKESNWEKLTQWYYAAFPNFTEYLHADQHTLVFNKRNPDVLYVGNDGGVFRSDDGGKTFSHKSKGYNVTQFYSLGFSPYGELVGGTQDNGTQLINWVSDTALTSSGIARGITKQSGLEIKGGDGGFSEFSRINPDIMFVESQFSTSVHSWLQRTRDKGMSLEYSNNDKFFLDAFVENYLEQNGAPFITPFSLWENPNDPESRDYIWFVNGITTVGVGAGDGTNSVFSGTLEPEQNSAEIDFTSVEYVTGDIVVSSGNTLPPLNDDEWETKYWFVEYDTSGVAIDSFEVSSMTNISTGEFTVDFGQSASLNVPVLARFKTNFDSGDTLNIESATLQLPLTHVLSSNLSYGDSVPVKDPVQSKFFLGANGAIWMTREPLDLSKEAVWMQISNNTGWGPRDIDWDANATCAFVAVGDKLFRISGLKFADDKAHGSVDGAYYLLESENIKDWSGTQAVTGVYVDKIDGNRVVVTLGNYGNNDYVYFSTNALSNNPTFQKIQGDLPKMPVYDALINVTDSSHILLATEFGIWSTHLEYIDLPNPINNTMSFEYISEIKDANGVIVDFDTTTVTQSYNVTQLLSPGQNPSWTMEDMGVGNVPCFSIRQQYYEGENFGQIYVATHGRGMYKSGTFTSSSEFDGPIDEIESEKETVDMFKVYPNPVVSNVNFEIPCDHEDQKSINIKVYDLSGKLVLNSISTVYFGNNTISLDMSQLNNGTYIIHVNGEGFENKYSKIFKGY